MPQNGHRGLRGWHLGPPDVIPIVWGCSSGRLTPLCKFVPSRGWAAFSGFRKAEGRLTWGSCGNVWSCPAPLCWNKVLCGKASISYRCHQVQALESTENPWQGPADSPDPSPSCLTLCLQQHSTCWWLLHAPCWSGFHIFIHTVPFTQTAPPNPFASQASCLSCKNELSTY